MENNRLYTYGILKRGYALDLKGYGGKFLGEAYIEDATLYGIGRLVGVQDDLPQYSGVGLRLDGLNTAYGELWEIPEDLWDWLDMIEQNGWCYERLLVPVRLDPGNELYTAWVYQHCYPGFKYEHPIADGRF